MKLLSWMHRKLQKEAAGLMQPSVVGNSCNCKVITPSKDSRPTWQQKQHYQDQIEEFNPKFNEEQSTDVFPGFLTIGTLNVDPISEPPTPTFDFEEKTEMKYDLKVINEELENFLKFEAEKEGNTESSRKNSEASTITLSDEVKEVGDQSSIKSQLYPLQGYPLGSSTEFREIMPKAKKEKASFYKFFKNCTNKSSVKANRRINVRIKRKHSDKIKSYDSVTNKTQQTTEAKSHMSNHSVDREAESFLTFRKLKKINQLFHKKIHPEIGKAEFSTEEPKSRKYETKKIQNTSYVDSVLDNGKSMIGCWGTLKKGKKHYSKTPTKFSEDAKTEKNLELAMEDTSGSVGREHWIRTDDEYFVLELQQNKGVQTSGLKVLYI